MLSLILITWCLWGSRWCFRSKRFFYLIYLIKKNSLWYAKPTCLCSKAKRNLNVIVRSHAVFYCIFIGMYIFIYIYQCFRKQRGLRMWLTFADKREGRVRSYLNSPYVILQWTRGLNQSKCPFDALWSTPYNMFLLMIIITFFLINL